MNLKLIRIGNSQGVRIPRSVIEQAELGTDLELEIVDGDVVIRPSRQARSGWSAAAKSCHENGDDVFDDWDNAAPDFAGDWE